MPGRHLINTFVKDNFISNKLKKMGGPIHTYHIHLTGIVQGVGFRPAVYTLAARHALEGYVCNAGDGLHVEFNATAAAAKGILQQLLEQPPPLARIESYSLAEASATHYTGFSIIESDESTMVNTALTPDFALCENCRRELHDKNNRRYRYPFITCTQCGPRYSIIAQMPYDRHYTSMAGFPMCEHCKAEYDDVHDRRYYSQTNSCHECGIQLRVYGNDQQLLGTGNENSLALISNSLPEGKIIAIKGIGGYLLICDAANKNSIEQLRKRKHRPTKPFALLCRDMQMIRELAHCTDTEEAWLRSAAAPILLLKANKEAAQHIAKESIAPGLDTLGLMLPNAPLLELISDAFGKAVICTSGNISGAPIIYKDEEALEQLSAIADIIVTHNREIYIPQDDSVLKICPGSEQVIILRRSRGLAPSLFNDAIRPGQSILATGALMKSSFTLSQQQYIYCSQYLGSTESYEAQQMYRHTCSHLLNTMKAAPELILCDAHPQYFSTQFAEEAAAHFHVNRKAIPHHKAHFAAVLAENNLRNHPGLVLGVIWDGTGWGDDKNSWGGEFFRYENNQMQRCAQFHYFPVLLGDKMAREPRLSALAICHELPGMEELLKHKFNEAEWPLYTGLLQKGTGLQTSSAGRLFDAAAALLGLMDKQSYEGEAALLLETAATRYRDESGGAPCESYFTNNDLHHALPVKTIFAGMISDILNKQTIGFIASRFHQSLVHAVRMVALHNGCRHLAFSGGVFQNSLLADLLQQQLGKENRLYFHQQLSPNDENISLGQLVYHCWKIDEAG